MERFVAWTSSHKQPNVLVIKSEIINMRKLQLAILAAALVGVSTASASFQVAFTGVGPGEVVNLQVVNTGSGVANFGPSGVNAGIYNLSIAGVATPSFCIDIDRNSGTFNDYNYATLSAAPLSPAGPMGLAHEIAIEKLWAAYYAPVMSNQDAAALQVAIWLSLGDNTLGYTVAASGNAAVTTEAAAMLAALPGLTAQADLIALVSPSGQNYIVAVPEPTTMIAGALLLLPFGASTLRILRKRQAA
jgi:hypothetical protein